MFHSWSAQELIDPLAVAGAEGSYFWDYDGNRYLDFTSGLVFTNIGYQHPKVVAAIQEQAATMTTFAPAFAVEARSEAARLIAERTPGDLDKIFFTNGGADAVEHAIRMARLHTGPPQGALRLPLVPRRHPAGDQPHRRPPPLGLRHRHGRRRPLLGAVPVPLPLLRGDRGAGVRARARAPGGHHRLRGARDHRRDHPGDHPRHRRDHDPAARLPRRRPRDLRPVRHRLRPGRGHGRASAVPASGSPPTSSTSCPI